MKTSFRFIFCLSLLLCTGTSFSQTITCNILGHLPSQVNESSGIDYYNSQNIWTHNDAGANDHHLYAVDTTGALVKTVNITNASNTDWEDITHDAGYNYMYIGDFGNNNYDRTDLKIYRVPYTSLLSGTSATADVIHFSYPDQTQFPSDWKNFDMEAFFHHDGMLYLFSKNSGNAVGYTKLYSLPDQPGTHVATLIDSFYTNNRITGGDINPSGTAIAIMSNAHIHLFQNWTGNNFFNGAHIDVSIVSANTQKEGIAFVTDNLVYLTDEADTLGNNYLYGADLSQWIPSLAGVSEIDNLQLAIYPNPATNQFTISTRLDIKETTIFNVLGEKVYSSEPNCKLPTVNCQLFLKGIYFVRVETQNFVSVKKLVVE